MNTELSNLSEIIKKYQLQISDLIVYSCIIPDQKTHDLLLRDIFTKVFYELRKNKHKAPLHIFVYKNAINTILNSKNIPSSVTPSIMILDNTVSINEYKLTTFTEKELMNAFSFLTPENRIILNLKYRQKLNTKEIASLFFTSSGTIYSKILTAKALIAENIIKTKLIIEKNTASSKKSNCFFITNIEPKYENDLLSNEEKQNVNNHILTCKSCKNFYDWQKSIGTAIENSKITSEIESINDSVFAKISAWSFFKNIKYFITTNWSIRLIAFLLTILLSAYIVKISEVVDIVRGIDITTKIAKTIQHKFNPVKLVLKNPPLKSETLTTDKKEAAKQEAAKQEAVKQEIAKQEPVRQETTTSSTTKTIEENVTQESIQQVYKFITQSLDWEQIDNKLKDLLKIVEARKAGQFGLGLENNGGSYYHFTIPKNKIDLFLENMNQITTFHLIKQKDNRKNPQNRLRVVIWIGRKGV